MTKHCPCMKADLTPFQGETLCGWFGFEHQLSCPFWQQPLKAEELDAELKSLRDSDFPKVLMVFEERLFDETLELPDP